MGSFWCSSRFEDKDENSEFQRNQRISSHRRDYSNDASYGGSFDKASNVNNFDYEEDDHQTNGFRYSKSKNKIIYFNYLILWLYFSK